MLRLAILCLLLGFLFCYLEWGHHAAFLFQLEYFILFSDRKAGNFLHPAIFLPFSGQLLLLYAILQKRPSRWLIIAGVLLSAVLVLLILIGGILTRNVKTILSTIPFLAIAVLLLWRGKRLSVGV